MSIRSKAIWITAAGIIGAGLAAQNLGWMDILGTYFVAKFLVMAFDEDSVKPDAVAKEPKIEKPKEVLLIPVGHHLITTDAVKQYRNLFLRHHNIKQTDASYIASDMSKQTVAIIATLNVFLKGKKP